MQTASAQGHSNNKSRFIVWVALSANVAIASAKLFAALVTGSSAMLAEAAHSFADSGNEVSLLLGLRLAARAPDASHPFGYGMERYFWTFMASIFMFIVGGSFSVFQGVSRLLSPQELEQIGISYAVLGIAAVFDGISFSLAFRGLKAQLAGSGLWTTLRRTKDPTLFIVLLEDSAALIGLALAFMGLLLYQWTGSAVFGAIASVLIGLLLGIVAMCLGLESRSLLLGEAAAPEIQNNIRCAVMHLPEVTGIVEMLTMHLAPEEILVVMDLNLQDNFTTDQIEMTLDHVENEVRRVVPQATRIYIECEPLRQVRRSRRIQP